MNLENFVKSYICKNTLLRLWIPYPGGHQLIYREDPSKPNDIDDVCMEWALLDRKHWLSEYLDREVIGVADIFVQGPYVEAVNIVIKLEE